MRTLIVGTALLAAVFTALPCRANLGDTLEKCEAHYGHPVPGKDTADPGGVGDIMLTFQSRGYTIRIVLLAGHTVAECFSKTAGSALTDDEKKIILHNDAQGWAWAHQTAFAGENWLRTDGSVAAYNPSARLLVLETAAYVGGARARQAEPRQSR
jgi:hypothetical protein